MDSRKVSQIEKQLKSSLSPGELNKISKENGFVIRKSKILAVPFISSLLNSLGTRKVETLTDLHRDFNYDNETFVHYHPYYNKLDTPCFPKMMQALLISMMSDMCIKMLEPLKGGAFEHFSDIQIHDGSSFALHSDLQDTFPGRFTTIKPAAVELHVTMSVTHDCVESVILTPDTESERHHKPRGDELRGKLNLLDRGYDDVKYFCEIDDNDGAFIIRTRSAAKPWGSKVFMRGKRQRHLEERRLDVVIRKLKKKKIYDLDVIMGKGKLQRTFRMILRYNKKEKAWIRLVTNLPRKDFTIDDIMKAYRLRWQLELVFKDWKSYTNLHRFNTRKANIAEGLIWASLCAAFLKRYFSNACQLTADEEEISSRIVAMISHTFLPDFFHSLRRGFYNLKEVLRKSFNFLRKNAARDNRARDRSSGKLALLNLKPKVA